MTPFEAERLDQEQTETADAAYQERYLDGSTDAAFGRLPEYANDAYLAGYVAKLKELPTNAGGRIIHYTPKQHFAFGRMDDPNPCSCDDGF